MIDLDQLRIEAVENREDVTAIRRYVRARMADERLIGRMPIIPRQRSEIDADRVRHEAICQACNGEGATTPEVIAKMRKLGCSMSDRTIYEDIVVLKSRNRIKAGAEIKRASNRTPVLVYFDNRMNQ